MEDQSYWDAIVERKRNMLMGLVLSVLVKIEREPDFTYSGNDATEGGSGASHEGIGFVVYGSEVSGSESVE